MSKKTCRRCGKTKPYDQFNKHSICRDKHATICRECAHEVYRAYYKASKGHPKVESRLPRKLPPMKSLCKPAGAIHKRCPVCRTHLYIMPSQKGHFCEKCSSILSVIPSLRDNTHHRGGLIVRKV